MQNLDDLPWDEIRQISQQGIFEQKFKKFPKSLFKFTVKEENRPKLIESALKSLRETNPNASYGQATLLVDIMQTFAQKMLKKAE